MYQRIGNAAFKKSLDNIISLCEALGNPQRRFKSIHVAGPNGTGSSSHMLAAVLQESGYKVYQYHHLSVSKLLTHPFIRRYELYINDQPEQAKSRESL